MAHVHDHATTPTRRRARTAALLGGGLVASAAGVWLLRSFDPTAPGSPFPPCLFQSVTGWYCPGCGITRCLHALVHGDLAQAVAMNPLLVLLLALTPVFAAWHLGWKPAWLRPVAKVLSTATFWISLLLVYWVARNLPWAPFAWLAPG